jgi:hypothetical protein
MKGCNVIIPLGQARRIPLDKRDSKIDYFISDLRTS